MNLGDASNQVELTKGNFLERLKEYADAALESAIPLGDFYLPVRINGYGRRKPGRRIPTRLFRKKNPILWEMVGRRNVS